MPCIAKDVNLKQITKNHKLHNGLPNCFIVIYHDFICQTKPLKLLWIFVCLLKGHTPFNSKAISRS